MRSLTRRATRTARTTVSAADSAGQLRGLLHAHMGWMFAVNPAADVQRYAKDLVDDPIVRFIDRTFLLWAVLGFVVPFWIGYAISGTWKGALTGLLWGGLVRLFLNHHVTWSVNSICHYFGRRPFAAHDQSTNNWVLALPSLGESWHHNHHVFPSSATSRAGTGADRPQRAHDRRLGEDRLGAQRAPPDHASRSCASRPEPRRSSSRRARQ